MHYKNGREAKNGDKVVWIPPYEGGTPVAGILYNAVAGNDYCNGRIAITSANDPYPNLKECLRSDDAVNEGRIKWAIVRDGTEGQARIVVESTTQAIGGFMTEAEAQEFIAAHNGE